MCFQVTFSEMVVGIGYPGSAEDPPVWKSSFPEWIRGKGSQESRQINFSVVFILYFVNGFHDDPYF